MATCLSVSYYETMDWVKWWLSGISSTLETAGEFAGATSAATILLSQVEANNASSVVCLFRISNAQCLIHNRYSAKYDGSYWNEPKLILSHRCAFARLRRILSSSTISMGGALGPAYKYHSNQYAPSAARSRHGCCTLFRGR